MPLTESTPAVWTVTTDVYQPLVPAVPAVTDSVADGADASNLRFSYAVPLVLPASSVQLPPTKAAAESGAVYVYSLHETMPLVASLPWNVNFTAWLYQVPWSATRSGVPETLLGAVASYWNVNATEALTFPALSVHVPSIEPVPVSGPLKSVTVQNAIPL